MRRGQKCAPIVCASPCRNKRCGTKGFLSNSALTFSSKTRAPAELQRRSDSFFSGNSTSADISILTASLQQSLSRRPYGSLKSNNYVNSFCIVVRLNVGAKLERHAAENRMMAKEI